MTERGWGVGSESDIAKFASHHEHMALYYEYSFPFFAGNQRKSERIGRRFAQTSLDWLKLRISLR